jgi:hypothetical protein
MKEDIGAMLFNLTTHASFPCKDPSNAIICYEDRGPCFGIASDLSAWYEPFNKEKARSWTNYDGFNIPRNSEGINMLTNLKNNGPFFDDLCTFTISEIEVWGVSFNE